MELGNKVNKAHVGFEEYYLAVLTKDTDEEVSYEEAKRFTNPITLSASPESEVVLGKAGNRDIETGQTKSGGTVSLDVWSIDSDILQKITGATRDEFGILHFKGDDISPHFGLICKTSKQKDAEGNSYDTYAAFPKVVFTLPGNEASTKDGLEFQNVSLEATVMEREYDGNYKFEVAENDEGFDKDELFKLVFKTEVKAEVTP